MALYGPRKNRPRQPATSCDQIRARAASPTPETASDNQLYSVNGSGTPSGLSAKVFILMAISVADVPTQPPINPVIHSSMPQPRNVGHPALLSIV